MSETDLSSVSSQSDFLRVRGLRYHVRRWGSESLPILVMTHGWLDVSETFDPMARLLASRFHVVMADWRGFGYTEWPQEGYWFQDYVGDLDALVDHYSPRDPIRLAGHSMGAQAAGLFAGLRPSRVSRLAILDGLQLPDGNVKKLPQRFAKWLDDIKAPVEVPSYRSFDELAGRIAKRHPRLSPERCAFVARCWGREGRDGLVWLMSDPKHMFDMPRPYRQEESDLIWQQVTAPTLFAMASLSPLARQLPPGEIERRQAQFRDHRVVSIENAGHMLHLDAPEATAKVLLEFF